MKVKTESIWYQFKVLLPILFLVYMPTLSLLCALVIVVLCTEIPMSYFTRDPSSILREPSYIGLLSNIGILLWCFTTAVCLFSFAVLRKGADNRELPPFLLFAGLITIILLLDDLFLLHELVKFSQLLGLLFMAGYGIVILLYLIKFRATVIKTEYLVLFFALGFFTISIVLDLSTDMGFLGVRTGLEYLFEDGSKLFGIVSWSTYFTRVCLQQVSATKIIDSCM